MSEKSEKPSELSFVSTLAEASYLVRRVAEPRPAGDSAKAAILRAWRRLAGWSHNRVKDVWYSDHRISISAEEIEQLRRAARMQALEREAKHEYQQLAERIARVEQTLRLGNPHLDRAELDEVCAMARGPNRPLD
jgi:hypothetical protein